MGLFSIRFCQCSRRFAYAFPLSTYVIHAVSENHFKLGIWAVTLIVYRKKTVYANPGRGDYGR